jgi:hypothetical protein
MAFGGFTIAEFPALGHYYLGSATEPDITFKELSIPPAGTYIFDQKTKQLTWKIPEMPTSVDVLGWPFSITLNNKNSSQNTLMSKVTLEAEDTVTGKVIKLTGPEIPLK